jgi:hypothetical protein
VFPELTKKSMISGFCGSVDENCTLLEYHAASNGNRFTNVSGQHISPIFKGQEVRD